MSDPKTPPVAVRTLAEVWARVGAACPGVDAELMAMSSTAFYSGAAAVLSQVERLLAAVAETEEGSAQEAEAIVRLDDTLEYWSAEVRAAHPEFYP
jgi:hypothetical protein